jgi:hypothetical protein
MTFHDNQSGPFGHRITASLKVHESAAVFDACLFEVKYMACWEISSDHHTP